MGHGDMSGLWNPDGIWMKDAMPHVLVTSCGTGRPHCRNGQITVAQPTEGYPGRDI